MEPCRFSPSPPLPLSASSSRLTQRSICAMLIRSMSCAPPTTTPRRHHRPGPRLAAGQHARRSVVCPCRRQSGVALDDAAAARPPAAQIRRRSPAVHRRNRRLRPARKRAQEGHQEGPQGDVPRDADGRRRRAARARRRRLRRIADAARIVRRRPWAATTCSPCPKTTKAA